ncbi:MAG TPA: DUF167 domain-containing protein [Candidatus Babeliales bacterium]|nr:DUF167 domain-containing protein [Candidatus Babeliales bacterium]
MAIIIEVKVVPSSGKQQCILDKTGTIKCYLKNPPERGKANQELIKMIAKAVDVPQADVQIVSGETTRNKKVRINKNVTVDQVIAALGIEQQMSIGM